MLGHRCYIDVILLEISRQWMLVVSPSIQIAYSKPSRLIYSDRYSMSVFTLGEEDIVDRRRRL